MKNFMPDLTSQKGSVLAGVIVMALVMAISSLGYLQLSTSTAKGELAGRDDAQAFWAAESGLLIGAEWLENPANYIQLEDLFAGYSIDDVVPGYSSNGMDVTVDIVKTASGAQIRSTVASSAKTGFNKVISQDAVIQGFPFDTSVFDDAIVCKGTFSFGGCGLITVSGGVNKTLHSNLALNITGSAGPQINITSSTSVDIANNVTVDGSVTSPVVTYEPSKATITNGVTIAAVPEVVIPDIDLTPWYDQALANNQVLDAMPAGDPYTPPGGVLWLRGSHTINSSINGTLITEGSLCLNGNVYSPDSGLAVAAINGDVRLGPGIARGLVYVKNGNFDQQANGSMQGQVIVNGSIAKNGNSNICVYKKCIPTPPDGSWDGIVTFIPGSWQETNVVSQ